MIDQLSTLADILLLLHWIQMLWVKPVIEFCVIESPHGDAESSTISELAVKSLDPQLPAYEMEQLVIGQFPVSVLLKKVSQSVKVEEGVISVDD